MQLLTSTAQIYLDGSKTRQTYSLYKTSSAENHKSADDVTLKSALISALTAAVGGGKSDQGGGVFRVRINEGKGYVVYRTPAGPGAGAGLTAAIFHYHWNYNLDLPLTAT
jgi:putative component of toxin-antitoxin plasmid stabilization module